MHSLNHVTLARTARADREREGRGPRPEPPPGRLRATGARVLARVAGRLDRETARRAVA